MNAFEIEESVKSLVAKGFNRKTFIIDFLKAYDAPKSLIQQLKGDHQNLSDISGGVLWRRNLHYKLADTGMVPSVITELRNSQATTKYKVRFVISTDGEEFSAHDLNTGNTVNCNFDEIDIHFAAFLSLAGIFFEKEIEENPIDIQATKRLTKFYDSILQDNPDWRTNEMRHTLNHFVTQIIFCLFAEDTGIIPKDIFSSTVRLYCENDSEQTKPVIEAIFTAMAHDAGAEVRSGLPGYTQKFPHVNGGLFRGNPQVPRFLRGSVRYLLDAGVLDWKEINPDIFGSMIQAIVHQDQRGELGMHYTSVSNILKLLKPLFLNDLQDQVNANWNSKKGLQAILQRLMKIRVFDPACGSGNFLVIAYRELRNIEIQVIRRLAEISDFSAGLWSHVDLKNFFGIEYIDFAAETAKLSLWIAEYQMNKRYEDEFGKFAPSLPLKDTSTIQQGNALRISWEAVCPHSDDSEVETYIVGNPPYIGTKNQKPMHKEDIKNIFIGISKNYKSLDYVSGWFYLGYLYIRETKNKCGLALVSTNSVCQSLHIQNLWKHIDLDYTPISFAYRAFHWKNNAAQNAGVTVIICGLTNFKPKNYYIFDGTTKKNVKKINPLLLEGDLPDITPRRAPISKLPSLKLGSLFADNNNFILENLDEVESLRSEIGHQADKIVFPYCGGSEFINSRERMCLFITKENKDIVEKSLFLKSRIRKVEKFRLSSDKVATRNKAETAFSYTESRVNPCYKNSRIIAPITFSGNRKYYHAGYVPGNTIIPATAYFIEDATEISFSVMSSKLFFIWMTSIGNTLRKDHRLSNTLCWNTFPMPNLNEMDEPLIVKCAENILLARDHYFEHTIAELYDPKNMEKKFPELWHAHLRNDEVLESIYNGQPFESDEERLEHLFARYVEMTSNPLKGERV